MRRSPTPAGHPYSAEPRARAGASSRCRFVPGLANGAYSVRWSIVSDDGHREEGLVAFAVGRGAASPRPCSAHRPALAWIDYVLRALYYLGLLAGGGRRRVRAGARGLAGSGCAPLAHLLFFASSRRSSAGAAIVHAAPPGTRYALVLKIALTASLVGGAAAALAPTYPALLVLAGACCARAARRADALRPFARPRPAARPRCGRRPRAHSTSAAVWFGGLLALAFIVPARPTRAERRARRPTLLDVALVAVIVLGVTGLGRALTELSAVSQVWSTSYGRALLVKSALFIPLLGVGWLNRSLLAGRVRTTPTVGARRG